jgi:TonB family protein
MMNLGVNYLFEASLALCAFLAMYLILFRNETNFTIKRLLLLAGLAISLVFPAFRIEGTAMNIPAIREVIPTVMLPEFVVIGKNEAGSGLLSYSSLSIVRYVYLAGVIISLCIFLLKILKLGTIIAKSNPVRRGRLFISESPESNPPFSFFSFIFIGQTHELSSKEKEQIIAHEAIHARQLHSFDIILLNIIGIFFWFNPVLRIYKNIFIQLHEFEADARSVKDEEMNDYCNLLARVALLSADIRIANHFSNSLTLKRIQMMRTIKNKIQTWKVAAMMLTVPAFFVLLSCQDQLVDEVTDIAKSSTVALDIPAEVQARLDQMKQKNPDKEFIVMEVDVNGQPKVAAVKQKLDNLPPESISTIDVIKNASGEESGSQRSFIIVEYTSQLQEIQQKSVIEDNVYTVVDDTALPADGLDKYYQYLASSIQYPKEARQNGVEGKVFVSFIVELDGTISDLKVMKGVSEDLNAEAIRVVSAGSKWTPGKNNGMFVRQRLVLPINFSLDDSIKKVGFRSVPD